MLKIRNCADDKRQQNTVKTKDCNEVPANPKNLFVCFKTWIDNKKLILFLQLSQKQYPVFLKTNLEHFQSHSPTGKDDIHECLFHNHANFVYGDSNETKIMKIPGQTSPPFD